MTPADMSIIEKARWLRALADDMERDRDYTPSVPVWLREIADEYEVLRQRKDGAYEERNRVVALLAAIAAAHPSILWDAGTARTAIEGWSEEWHGCVYIDTPEGQLSWHYHDSQAHLFAGLPRYTGTWDGHTTEAKYERVAQLVERLLGDMRIAR